MSVVSKEFNSVLKLNAETSVFEQASDLQAQAARVGFDWPDVQAVLEKVDEELTELKEAIAQPDDKAHIEEELADLIFVLVNVGRHLGLPLETTLAKANQKFIERFHYIEKQAQAQDRPISDLSLDEMDFFWTKAKHHIGNP